MKKFSCINHINHALDLFIADVKDFPILEELTEEQKLSTKCSYCEEQAVYIVSSK